MSHSESSSTKTLVWIRAAGFLLFALGLSVFVLSLSLSDYRLTEETFNRLAASGAVQEKHQEALFGELDSLRDKYYKSTHTFLSDIDRKISETNERLGGGAKIWDYDRGQYRLAIVREAATGLLPSRTRLFFLLSLILGSLGAIIHFLPRLWLEPEGIKNNGVFFHSAKSRGFWGIALGVFLIGFYIALYFFPAYIVNWIRLGDPISEALRGRPADRWFFYGLMYTLTLLVMAVRMAIHYRHNRYQLVRTASVSFFQLGFAFLIPAVLEALNKPAIDLKNAWPLNYSFFYKYNLDGLMSSGAFGWFILLWGIGLAVILVPLLAVFFGKRWYCSWVCGCGGLAETLGDPFRHLSDKSLKAWKAERWIVHSVLVFAVVMTSIVLINFFSGQDGQPLLGEATGKFQTWYGFLIGSIFAGVVGTGFYPVLGNRVWCRFGCPLAAILGLVQKFKSRFRITTNGGQCISCGNCSTYCEMGIDVRWYAQRGQNIIRSSCVGCGICSAVCPRGVLRLENGPEEGRYNEVSLVQIGQGRIDVA
ncbi:MAG: 4Fe-4S binding protein [Deltaproteobacteria bacterium]|nr:4Fe-4S binding protein [Deltaproteobacteria bacterium]